MREEYAGKVALPQSEAAYFCRCQANRYGVEFEGTMETGVMAEQPGYLRQVTERLRNAFKEKLVGVVLYGSRARGEARESSDVDLLVIARDLPEGWYDRQIRLHTPLRCIAGAPPILVLGYTPEEFERDFSPIYLDIGLDGVVLCDQDGYTANRLERIHEIINQTGLVRLRLSDKSMFWNWNRKVTAPWEITWEGFRELA